MPRGEKSYSEYYLCRKRNQVREREREPRWHWLTLPNTYKVLHNGLNHCSVKSDFAPETCQLVKSSFLSLFLDLVEVCVLQAFTSIIPCKN